MGIIVSESTTGDRKDYEPVESGLHEAVCCMLCEIGTHHDERYNKDKREIIVGFQIPSLRIEYERDGQKVDAPRCVSKKYTLSLGERANLRKDLESWRGRQFTPEELSGFELLSVLKVPCLLNIMHHTTQSGRVYANITAILPSKNKTQVDFMAGLF